MFLENRREYTNQTCKDGKVSYNDTVMDFFNEVLDFVGTLRGVYRTAGNANIGLQFQGETIVNVLEDNFAEKILRFVLMFCNTPSAEQNYVKISAEGISEKYQKRTTRRFLVKNGALHDIDKITEVMISLDQTFLDRETKNLIKDYLSKLQCCLLENQSEQFLWKKEAIFVYLNGYYEVLRLILCKDGVLETEGVCEKLLLPMLQLGMDWDENSEDMQIRMIAPIVLSALNLIYDKLQQFVLLEINEQTEKTIYKEIFLSKIHQIFRFYFVKDGNNHLYHAAVAAYKEEKMKDELVILGKNLEKYNSFQGIRELRLADKILYEIGNRKFTSNCHEYNIVIFGEIHYAPMKELIQYIEKKFEGKIQQGKEICLKLQFEIFTKTLPVEREILSDNCSCRFYAYENDLVNVKKLQALLDKGDLIFVLDNCDLYKLSIEPLRDTIIFKQFISSENYEEHYKRLHSKDLVLDCKFMDLYNVLNMYAWSGELGFLQKRAKEDLIKYIQNIIYSANDKIAYVYISDIEAFRGLSCIQEHMVRIEKYNQNEIGIILFANQKKEVLKVSYIPQSNNELTKRMLVFNVWQFVKHIILNQKEEFENAILLEPQKQFLDSVYVGLDYTEWKEKIEINYYYEDGSEINVNQFKHFLKTILYKVFSKKGNMYQRYLKKSFVSFLFGAAKSVEDLIFLHVFKNKGELIGSVDLEDENCIAYNPQVKMYHNLNCKYSYKRMYWEAIETIDWEGFNFFERYKVLSLIDSVKNSANDYEEIQYMDDFFENIVQAAKNICYESSLLYFNCLKETE